MSNVQRRVLEHCSLVLSIALQQQQQHSRMLRQLSNRTISFGRAVTRSLSRRSVYTASSGSANEASNWIADFRSDTGSFIRSSERDIYADRYLIGAICIDMLVAVTKPTPEMLRAMMNAPIGDDVLDVGYSLSEREREREREISITADINKIVYVRACVGRSNCTAT